LLVVLASPGVARALEDPDTEVARRHFEKGRAAYDNQDYHRALTEFIAARRAKPSAGLDYNIGRCYDRLEDYGSAIRYYALYLNGTPNAGDHAEISERIKVLQHRIDEASEAAARTRPTRPPEREPELLLKPSSFDEKSAPTKPTVEPTIVPPTTPAVANRALVSPSVEEENRRRRRNIGIGVGVAAAVVVIAGAIALGVVLGSSPAPQYTHSQLGTWSGTL
jgi:hypothetical protein